MAGVWHPPSIRLGSGASLDFGPQILSRLAQFQRLIGEAFFQIGPLTIQHDETKTIPITPIVGGVLVAAGVAALYMGNRRNI